MKTIVGIDWSEKKHCVHAYNEAGAQLMRREVPVTIAGYQKLVEALKKVNRKPANCLVAIETAHNLLVDYLHEQGYTLYIVAPSMVRSNRGRQGNSGAKDDDRDARLLAEILRTDLGRLIAWQPDGPLVRQMRTLLSWVDRLTKKSVQLRNQLRASLLRCYPQALVAFTGLQSQFSLRFLAAFPEPAIVQGLGFEQFVAFCREQGYYQKSCYPTLWVTLRAEAPALNQQDASPYRQLVVWQAEQLLVTILQKQQVIGQVQALFQQHPDAFIFESLPGAGDLLAPKLLVMFGDHRHRYPTREWLPAIAGTAPVTIASGQSRFVKFRRACNHSFRQTAQQFAQCSTRRSLWAADYFRRLCESGKSKSHAYRCLANRWLHIIWTLWQRRESYDESYHLEQVGQHRRPLASR